MSFNLNEEKFNSVEPPKIYERHLVVCNQMQFSGRLSIFYPLMHKMLILYTLDDRESSAWIKTEITYPNEFQCRAYTCVSPLPTGHILLVNAQVQGDLSPLYSCNYESNEF